MNNIDSSRLLAEMQKMVQTASAKPVGIENAVISNRNTVTEKVNFGDLLSNAIGGVNELQLTAGDLSNRLVRGDADVSIAQTMIAGQKSSLAFEATVQVRNKLVQAYQDIMNMPV